MLASRVAMKMPTVVTVRVTHLYSKLYGPWLGGNSFDRRDFNGWDFCCCINGQFQAAGGCFTSQTAASVPGRIFSGRFLSGRENGRFFTDRACYRRVWDFDEVESFAFSF